MSSEHNTQEFEPKKNYVLQLWVKGQKMSEATYSLAEHVKVPADYITTKYATTWETYIEVVV